jgi:hypothetical protein
MLIVACSIVVLNLAALAVLVWLPVHVRAQEQRVSSPIDFELSASNARLAGDAI